MQKAAPEVQLIQRTARTVLVATFVLAVLGLFWASKRSYLQDHDAMAIGVVARNIAQGRGFTTDAPTPLSLHFVPRVDRHPELRLLPIYPAIASLAFKLASPSDSLLIAVSASFFAIQLIVIYLVALRWFNETVALLTVTLCGMHFLLLSQATNGLPYTFAGFLFALLTLLLLSPSLTRCFDWKKPLAAGLICGLGLLSIWQFFPVAIATLFAVPFLSPRGHRLRATALYALVLLLVLTPWVVRSSLIAKRPFFTLEGYELIMRTGQWPGESLYRSFTNIPSNAALAALFHPRTMLGKINRGFRFFYGRLPNAFNPYIFALFVAALLAPIDWSEAARRCRNWLIASIALTALFECLYTPKLEAFSLFAPFAVMFAVGLLWHLARQLSASIPFFQAHPSLAVLLPNLLLFLTMAYPLADILFLNPAVPKPPLREFFTAAADNSKLVMTDVPYALAWYSGKKAMLFVHHPNDLHHLRKAGIQPDVIYLSPDILKKPRSELVKFWKAMLMRPRPIDGYVPDRTWRRAGRRWLLKSSSSAHSPSTDRTPSPPSPNKTPRPSN